VARELETGEFERVSLDGGAPQTPTESPTAGPRR
jgi:hypothetical protein